MKRNGLPFVAREFRHRRLNSCSIGPKVVFYDTKAGANQQQFVAPKPKANTSLKLKDPLDQQGTLNMAPNRNVTVRMAPTHTNAVDDGLGTPWMPQNFGGGTPFSSAQSDIQFASQADTTQGTIPPNQQGTTSSDDEATRRLS